ncbi:MAG: Crp/Fnr family transcriptional regulator [Dehalococcoidales bacterium]|nr:MAG: Crp/Fnr family transcriptional regulator [Dehalococcoidales bacterium]
MDKKILDAVKSSALFRNIDDESLGVMLECLNPRMKKYKQREIIVSYGQPFTGIGIIAAGRVTLTKEQYSGNRIIMGFLDEGHIFGEMIAFSDRKVWPVTVISQEDSTVLYLPPNRITTTCSNVCASHTTLIMNMLGILSNRALMLNRKIDHISAKSIRGKISSYLIDILRESSNNTINIPMKRHELADYLNIPRPSLSRELGLMRDEGMITFEGSTVVINDIAKLEESMV